MSAPGLEALLRTTRSKAAAAARIDAELTAACWPVRVGVGQRDPEADGWSIAEQVGDRTPDRAQRLLNRAVWDALAVMSRVRRFAVAGLDAMADQRRRRGPRIAALDETGQQKAGTATAGLANGGCRTSLRDRELSEEGCWF